MGQDAHRTGSPTSMAGEVRASARARLEEVIGPLWHTARPPGAPDAPERVQAAVVRQYISYAQSPPQLTIDGALRWSWPRGDGGGWWQVHEAPVHIVGDGSPELLPPAPPQIDAQLPPPDPLAAMRTGAMTSRLGLLLDHKLGGSARMRLCEPMAIRPRGDGAPGQEVLLCLRLWWSQRRPRRGRVLLRLRLDPAGQLVQFRHGSADPAGESDFASVDHHLLPAAVSDSADPVLPRDALAILSAAAEQAPERQLGLRALERGLISLSADGDMVAYAAAGREWRRIVTLVPRAFLHDGPRGRAYLRAWADAFFRTGTPRQDDGDIRLDGSSLLEEPAFRTEDHFRQALLQEIFEP